MNAVFLIDTIPEKRQTSTMWWKHYFVLGTKTISLIYTVKEIRGPKLLEETIAYTEINKVYS